MRRAYDMEGMVESSLIASCSNYTTDSSGWKVSSVLLDDTVTGLVELLNRAQCCSADDQRGLLRKEDLILPNFLELPLEEHDEEEEQQEEQRGAAPQAFSSTENLEEPDSNTTAVSANSSTSSFTTTEPVDRKLTKECSNPARETVV